MSDCQTRVHAARASGLGVPLLAAWLAFAPGAGAGGDPADTTTLVFSLADGTPLAGTVLEWWPADDGQRKRVEPCAAPPCMQWTPETPLPDGEIAFYLLRARAGERGCFDTFVGRRQARSAGGGAVRVVLAPGLAICD